jgi:hypothetical protein
MNKPRINSVTLLFSLAFLVALFIRLAGLGNAFLNDSEGVWAMQALKLAQGTHPDIGSQPGLVIFTGALFFLFNSSNFLARFLPALAGALLVLAPILFINRLGRPAAIIAAFGLALDPGLIAMSRQVDGHMLALTFTVLGLGFFYIRKPVAGGISFGLALLGGSSVWLGWLGILVTGLIYRIARLRRKESPQSILEDVQSNPELPAGYSRTVLLAFAGTVFIGGTLFFLEPKALSGIAGSLVAFVTAQVSSAPISIGLVIAGLVFYAPLPAGLALIASVRAVVRKTGLDGLLATWWLVAFFLAIAYPGRQVADLVWVLVPMWVLAARLSARFFEGGFPARMELAQAVLTVVLLVCAWLNFVSAQVNLGQDRTPHWASIVFMIFFLAISVILFTWGWNSRVALRGLGIGVYFLLTLFMLSTAGRATGIVPRPEQELWRIGPEFEEAGLLVQTTGDFSGWNSGERNTLDLVVTGGSPALQWLFRSNTKADFVNVLPVDATPSLVITGNQTSLSLPGSYTGQSFVLDEQPNWSTMQSSDWMEWMLFRDAPVTKGLVVLWVRSNLFPGSADFNQKRTN